MSIEAMKQVKLFLEHLTTHSWTLADQRKAITSLSQAIAEAEKQEPEGWLFRFPTSDRWHYTPHFPHDKSKPKLIWKAIYTHPQPKAEQEPVFWYRPRSDGFYEGPLHNAQIETVRKECGAWKPLYTHPHPKREPLTDQQIWDAVQHGVVGSIGFPSKAIAVARAIEAAHGIKGEA